MSIQNIFSRRNRILLRELVITDFKLRYQGSVLGYLWSLLKPLMLFTIMYLVFVKFLRFGEGVEHFEVSLLLGIVLWTFFTEATNQGMQAIAARGDLIRKIKFPKYIIVISGTLSALINLILNLLVVLFFVAINGVDIRWSVLLLPFNILELFAFALAVAFALSALFVKYRDIAPIWEVIMQGLFYATPIIYPISLILNTAGVDVAKLLLLNPVAQIIQDARYNAISHDNATLDTLTDNPLLIATPYVIVVAVIVFATWYFKKSQRSFAENV